MFGQIKCLRSEFRELSSENVLGRVRFEGDGAEGEIILGLHWVNYAVKVWN